MIILAKQVVWDTGTQIKMLHSKKKSRKYRKEAEKYIIYFGGHIQYFHLKIFFLTDAT